MPINIEKYSFFEGLGSDTEFIFEGLKVAILEEIVMTMKAKGISRAELSRKLGTSRAYITRMLRADVNFTLIKLVQIALALGTQLDVHFLIPDIRVAWIDKIEKELVPHNEPLNYGDTFDDLSLTNRSNSETGTDTA